MVVSDLVGDARNGGKLFRSGKEGGRRASTSHPKANREASKAMPPNQLLLQPTSPSLVSAREPCNFLSSGCADADDGWVGEERRRWPESRNIGVAVAWKEAQREHGNGDAVCIFAMGHVGDDEQSMCAFTRKYKLRSMGPAGRRGDRIHEAVLQQFELSAKGTADGVSDWGGGAILMTARTRAKPGECSRCI